MSLLRSEIAWPGGGEPFRFWDCEFAAKRQALGRQAVGGFDGFDAGPVEFGYSTQRIAGFDGVQGLHRSYRCAHAFGGGQRGGLRGCAEVGSDGGSRYGRRTGARRRIQSRVLCGPGRFAGRQGRQPGRRASRTCGHDGIRLNPLQEQHHQEDHMSSEHRVNRLLKAVAVIAGRHIDQGNIRDKWI